MTELKVEVFKGFNQVAEMKFIRRNGQVTMVSKSGFNDSLLYESIWYALVNNELCGEVSLIEEDEEGFDCEIEYTWEARK